jgi:hypothetical protein
MKRRALAALAVTTALSAAISTALFAQGEYQVPRMSDGTPDLQGVWKNATVTPLTRPRELGNRQAYTRDEAYALEREAQMAVEQDNEPLDPNRPAPEATALPPVGNYDLFWTDRGMIIPDIYGEFRTSIVIDPPDGQIPAYTEGFRQRQAAERASMPGPFDGPEGRGPAERCLLSFGSSSGPPMLPVMYNSMYQIVQSPGYVVILVEMVHDARIIRLADDHSEVAEAHQKWMGDSVGRWDGDTLIVETRHFNPQQSFRGASQNLTVTEHFTRVSEDKIIYRFTVDDPTTFVASWTGELPLSAQFDEKIFEYACHEGNYALPGTLAGARMAEREAAAAGNR